MYFIKKYRSIIYPLLLCIFNLYCNSGEIETTEQTGNLAKRVSVDSTFTNKEISVAENDTTAKSIMLDTGVIKSISTIIIKPKASIAYSYKDTVKVGEKSEIRVRVQLAKTEESVKADLLTKLNQTEFKAKEAGSSDTSIVRTLLLAGYKYFKIVPNYNHSIFSIETLSDSIQELDSTRSNNWLWMATALKKTQRDYINLVVTGVDESKKEYTIDDGDLPVTVTVVRRSLPFGWIALAAVLGAALAFIFIGKRKKNNADTGPAKIYFSYKWDKDEDVIKQLYNSLIKAGFLVQIDKKDLQYKDSITNFMSDIGQAKYVIVALSKDYLTSRYCMYEMFQIYLGSGMNKSEFQKRVFPIHLENLHIDNLEEVNAYTRHWEQEAADLKALISSNANNVNAELAVEYDFMRRLINDNGNLLACLSDINALNVATLQSTDFKDLKAALQKAIDSNK